MADDVKALLMLSGGPDSATLASLVDRKLPDGFKAHAIYLRSGHPADVREIEAAERIVSRIGGARLEIIDIADVLKALWSDRAPSQLRAAILPLGGGIALSVMMSCAIKYDAAAVYVGLHRDEVDEKAEYSRNSIERLEALAAAECGAAPKILTPFLAMTKAEVLKLGAALGVPYELTWSCMRAEEIHCGQCIPCRARRRAFAAAGLTDPTRYQQMQPG
jgi:7-cyano-7-deazaguanine synthase